MAQPLKERGVWLSRRPIIVYRTHVNERTNTMKNNSKDDNKVLIYTVGTFGEILSARIPVTNKDTERSIIVKASKRFNEKAGK